MLYGPLWPDVTLCGVWDCDAHTMIIVVERVTQRKWMAKKGGPAKRKDREGEGGEREIKNKLTF